jgi:hypothetical protein
VTSDVGECFIESATKPLEIQNDMVGIRMLAKARIIMLETTNTRSRNAIQDMVFVEPWSEIADDD